MTYEKLKQLSDAQLQQMLYQLLPVEASMDEEFWKARKKLADSELQLLGFEIYGKDGRHYFSGVSCITTASNGGLILLRLRVS